uniref:Uncharacterized protein n=1 Tax=viral metagenome TaxID=1070528 RepID=A0A6M3LLB8_9ZZZZ
MIEQYPWILDYGISPDTRPFVVGYTAGGVEGTFIPPTPVPQKDEVHGQTTGRPEGEQAILAGEWPTMARARRSQPVINLIPYRAGVAE